MPYSLLYKKFFLKEQRTSKSKLKPRKIYNISGYQYADGSIESFSGNKSAYIFLLGIFNRKLYCLKLTQIRPDMFFKWLKTLFVKNLKESDFIEGKLLSNYMILGDKPGRKLFNSYTKGKQIYSKDPSPFRTYNLDGIKQITEVVVKVDVLKSLYGIKSIEEEPTTPEENNQNIKKSNSLTNKVAPITPITLKSAGASTKAEN